MSQIKLFITDFDGTLVNTFNANLLAYQEAFSAIGRTISEEEYRRCFGLRFDDFMEAMNVRDTETRERIRQKKADVYPNYFSHFVINTPLLGMLKAFRLSGGLTALASTARKTNLLNAITFIGANEVFSYVLSGEDVLNGKPDPEIYENILFHFGISPNEALVFEDSEVGVQAASNAGIQVVRVVL